MMRTRFQRLGDWRRGIEGLEIGRLKELAIERWMTEGLEIMKSANLAIGKSLLLASLFLALAGNALAQTKTTVTDTLYSPAGNTLSGTITIANNATFTAADGTIVPKGTIATATVANGTFSVALVPNTGSTPSGSSYNVIYSLGSVYLNETWVVPSSGPVGLAAVRTSPPPSLNVLIAASQLPATINGSAIEDKGGQVFNVKSYGAAGDGTTNDSTAIAAAETAAAASHGVVFFPCGTYEVASGLTISGSLSFEGSGQSCSTIQATAALTGDEISVAASGVTFRHITIDAAQHASHAIAVAVAASNVTLEQATAENSQGFNFSASGPGISNLLVTDSTFVGGGPGDFYFGMSGSYSASNVRIVNSTFGSTAAPSNLDAGQAHVSLYVTTASGAALSGVTIANNQVYFPILAAQESDGIVVAAGLTSVGTLSNVTVSSNLIEGTPGTNPAYYSNGLEVGNADAVTISSNVLINGQHGILVEPDTANDAIHGSITGNYVSDALTGATNAIDIRGYCLYSAVGNYVQSGTAGAAISQAGQGAVSGNQIIAGQHGIIVNNGGVPVSGNTITESSATGYPIEMRCLQASACLSNSVTGNTIHGHASGYGIYFVNSTQPFANLSVSGNTIDSSYYGIIFNTTGDSGIIGNNSFSSVTKPYYAIPAAVVSAQVGSAAPSGSCANGSRYVNTAGGSGTTFYGCEAGAWAAK
ncbi:MAG TPA: glycosyl hydrolase family 28-related protein [Candidatus Acidoferrales bacterium]|nr:glycosyl hydrolase family 28-related protein [Candidatus Acidoferrales bacterium]